MAAALGSTSPLSSHSLYDVAVRFLHVLGGASTFGGTVPSFVRAQRLVELGGVPLSEPNRAEGDRLRMGSVVGVVCRQIFPLFYGEDPWTPASSSYPPAMHCELLFRFIGHTLGVDG
jgi:hypothetical protein